MEKINTLVVTAILVFISLPASGISNPDSKEDLIGNIPSVKVISWEEKDKRSQIRFPFLSPPPCKLGLMHSHQVRRAAEALR